MGIVRLVLSADAVPPALVAHLVIQPVDIGRDVADITGLVGRCAAVDGPAMAGPAVASIAAELASRPGRRVWAWRARQIDEPTTVGVVTLVAAGVEDPARFSIGWLFVDPAVRRRGIGRALIGVACEEARMQGAAEIHVETLDRWPAALAFWNSDEVGGRGVPG